MISTFFKWLPLAIALVNLYHEPESTQAQVEVIAQAAILSREETRRREDEPE